MQGDEHAPVALAGFMMTADEWKALDAASRALLIAIATAPEDLASLEGSASVAGQMGGQIELPLFAVGTAPITDEEATR